jgi:hypothetical protein
LAREIPDEIVLRSIRLLNPRIADPEHLTRQHLCVRACLASAGNPSLAAWPDAHWPTASGRAALRGSSRAAADHTAASACALGGRLVAKANELATAVG